MVKIVPFETTLLDLLMVANVVSCFNFFLCLKRADILEIDVRHTLYLFLLTFLEEKAFGLFESYYKRHFFHYCFEFVFVDCFG